MKVSWERVLLSLSFLTLLDIPLLTVSVQEPQNIAEYGLRIYMSQEGRAMLKIKKGLIAISFIGIVLSLNACVAVRTTGHPGPYGHEVYWYYYPDFEIYYHATDHYYYYYDGGVWIRTYTLPKRYVIRDGRRVQINVSGLPYVQHSHHLRRYPPKRTDHRHLPERRDDRDHRRRHERDDDEMDNGRHQRNDRDYRSDREKMELKRKFEPHPYETKAEEKKQFDKRYESKGKPFGSSYSSRDGKPEDKSGSDKGKRDDNNKKYVKNKGKDKDKERGKGKDRRARDDSDEEKGDNSNQDKTNKRNFFNR